MAWQIQGDHFAPCSCRVGCPCALGETEADQGWCSGVIAMNIRSGNIDGTDVSGAKVAMAVHFPGGMLAGNGKGRLYFDPAVSDEQRAGLEAVLTGKRGGVFEVLATLVPQTLPSKEAAIDFQIGPDETRATVGDVGEIMVKPMRAQSGEYTRLLHGAAAFRDDIILARGHGTRWRDPELRQWESAGHGEQADFDWGG